jgi:D-alanine-D-alanine ligase-like ATP-grasp enzyme
MEDGLDPNAVCLREAALRAGLEVTREFLPSRKGVRRPLLRIAAGGTIYYYRKGALRRSPKSGAAADHVNGSAVLATISKAATKALLTAASLPVPKGRPFDRHHLPEAVNYAANLGHTACIKPDNGALGRFVFPACRGHEEILFALQTVFRFSDAALVEESVAGGLYRLLYVEPDIVGIQSSLPASVTGDGASTVRGLIDAFNRERERRQLPGHEPMAIDEEMTACIASQAWSLDSVLPAGTRLSLSTTAAIGRLGGEDSECVALMHPSYIEIARSACRAVEGLRLAAVDFKIVDPTRPAAPGNCWIIELNGSPAIETFHHPWRGRAQDVASAVVGLMKREPTGERATREADERLDLDPHALLLREAAERAGVATRTVAVADRRSMTRPHLRLIVGKSGFYFRAGALRHASGADPDLPGLHINGDAIRVSSSKGDTKKVLAAAGLSVPMGRVFASDQPDDAVAYAATLGDPVCVKPDKGAKGRLVFPGRKGDKAVADAFHRVAARYAEVLVEESVSGEEIRFFYVEPRAVAVKMSVRPAVLGDGIHTVLELVQAKNRDDMASRLADQKPVLPEHTLVTLLAEQGLDLLDIPERDRAVFLDRTANGTRGGGHVECRDSVHESYWRCVEKAFAAIPGMAIGAVDMIVRDRTQPAAGGNYWILELNSSPSLLPYHRPWKGRPQDVSGAIIDYLRQLNAA